MAFLWNYKWLYTIYHVSSLRITKLMKAGNSSFANVYPGPAESSTQHVLKYLLIKQQMHE